jgi:anaerobic dimethyl sulfoxide reductase subunit C (anchor subunit)
MNTQELALVVYTTLVQMSVGAFVILGLVHFYAEHKSDTNNASEMSDRALLAIGPVVVMGVLASFFHLGNPINAFRAVSNLGTSWLSREILFTVLFVGTGAVFALLQWRKIGSFRLRQIVALVAAVLGLALVYSMSNIYQLTAEPAWNSVSTTLSFFITTFLLGALALGVAFTVNYFYLKGKQDKANVALQSEMLRTVLQGIALGSIALLGLQLAIIPLSISQLAAGSPAAVESAGQFTNTYGPIFALRLILVILGAGLFGLFLYRSALLNKERLMANFVFAAFAAVLVAELLGRFLFYAAHARIGI